MKNFIKIKEFYLKRRFLYNLILLSALFFGHCFWGEMMYVVFPIIALLIILDNLENGISYIIFAIPFCFLNIYISALLLLACGVVYIIKFYSIHFFKEKNRPNYIILFFLLLFLTYCLMPIGTYNIFTLIRFLLFGAIFIAFRGITLKPHIFRGHFNVRLLCYSIILASVMSLSYYISPYLQETFISYIENGVPRFTALFYQPNVLAMFCEVLLSFLAYFIIKKEASLEEIILFGIMACIGLLTLSKTFIIILALLLVILFIWGLCTNYKKTLIISAIILLVGLVLGLILKDKVIIYINRFIGSINECKSFADFMNMVTTGRYDLWITYLTYIAKHPLTLFFGRGLAAPMLSIFSVHNAYIAIIYELGLVGTALFGLSLFFIFRDFFKRTKLKPHYAIFVPLLVFGLIFMVEDLIFFIFE